MALRSPAIDMQEHLTAQNDVDFPVVFGGLPEQVKSVEVCAVTDYGGAPAISPSERVYSNNFQVRTRAKTYARALEMSRICQKYLDIAPELDFDGTKYTGIWLISGPAHIRDEKAKELAVCSTNYRCVLTAPDSYAN